jgi:bifunctional non-homologous end joining protein LigD
VAEVAGVRLTHANRVVYPSQGVTKRDLALFYESIADRILPHLAGRPTSLVRCPEGVDKECFYQKHSGLSVPENIRRVKIREKKKVGDYLVVDTLPALISLVQIGILEIHTWNSVADRLEQPDRVVFDLDPAPDVPWTRVVAAARLVRKLLEGVGLESFVKTTGGKGLHVVAPIARGVGWDDFKAFSKAVVEAMERDEPDAYTTNPIKLRRKGKIFLDYLRNGRGATFIAPYSPRARPGAPVALPISWDELAHGVDPATFTSETVPRRLVSLREDPWKSMVGLKQSITASARRAFGGKR